MNCDCATVRVPPMMFRPFVTASGGLAANLPNATRLGPTIDRQLAACRRNGTTLAVLSIALGGVEIVKARHGQATQDRVLDAAWNRLRSLLRTSDLAMHTAADEFEVVLLNAGQAAAAIVSARVIDALSAPYELHTPALTVSVRTGAAVYPPAGSTGAALLRCARQARESPSAVAVLPPGHCPTPDNRG